MSDKPNPYAVTTLELADTTYQPDPQRWRFVEILVLMSVAALLFALWATWMDVKTIVFSGAIMVLTGSVLLFSTRRRSKNLRWVSYVYVVYPFFIAAIINVMDWNPARAQLPVSIISTLFVTCFVAYLLITWSRQRRFDVDSDTKQAKLEIAEETAAQSPLL